jgi:hypothetical protein
MPRYFIHPWKNSTWEEHCHLDGQVLEHTASNDFRSKRMRTGDFIYIVTVKEGVLILGTRIEVGEICSQAQAESYLGTLWEADDHVIAREGSEILFRLDRFVPPEQARELQCISSKNEKVPPKFRANSSKLDQQTLRTVRELAPESATLLDRFLESGRKKSRKTRD